MANYLPLLLVSVSTNAIPDDTSLSTQARGQVDYLSHQWKEEDVWRSWRNMTRQKNEIANGPRLENASWRTWWKQRNGLKTISPETLNWLKDSDVTWLYGPLHTALDWSPPPKPQEDPTSVEKDHSAHDRLDLTGDPPLHKPILKHRTIGELLTSALPSVVHDEDGHPAYLDQGNFVEDARDSDPVRPALLHTKSDTNIMRWTTQQHRSQFRKDSPPRIIAQQPSSPEAFPAEVPKLGSNERSGSSDSARDSSSQDLNAMGRPAKRHITFNTFVEQCIAIDSPPKTKKPSPDGRWAAYEDYDDGYEEDSEAGFNELEDGGMFLSDHESDDDDGVLEISTPSSRSRSSSSSRSRPNVPAPPYPNHPVIDDTFNRPILVHTNSSDKEHMTIAPIAPTILKTTGVGNNTPTHGTNNATVNLVYIPSGYTSNGNNSSGLKRRGSSDDVYQHREARFSVEGSSSSGSSRSPSTNTSERVSPVPSAEALPPPIPIPIQYGHKPNLEPPSPGAGRFLSSTRQSPFVESPMGIDGVADDVYEYFGAAARPQAARFGLGLGADADISLDDVQEVETYVQPPGTAVDYTKLPRTRSDDMPEVVVNDENGAIEERRESRETSRSRSRSRSKSRSRSHSHSHSRTPSPAEMVTVEQAGEPPRRTASSTSVPVPRARSSSHRDLPRTASADSALLSPPPSRGRTLGTATPPIGRSMSSSDSERGRSASRGALSDRERSASRGGTGSPMGSVSPTGSAVALQYAVYAQGRGGLKRAASGSDGEGSARGRAGKRAGEASASPPIGADGASPSSSSGPSTSSPRSSGEISRPSLTIPKIPAPIVEEDETMRSAGSTPHATTFSSLSSSRPDAVTAKSLASSPGQFPTPPPSPPSTSVKTAGPGSPTTGGKNQPGPASPTSPREDSMVGRAVSSAKGFLGSIWQ